ncbi:hypothetical protein ACX27_10530 [Nostoc piscinale CENA21]|uniref:Uncharacterized protein n=1 Tax=Nostoc piscinale CENA21 TaxID=224013 RepID=A0A0M4T1P6_9NOSO|nr:hypothetical protein [Nostoc piscinale]ALF53182.1 hypothetical protein ACX27_10530 [Nostoc piscinale CENA21]
MSKIIYDVVQRFEVENGVPRLVSTNIQVIEGGEDLLSLAINMLAKLGFYDKFEENQTSQYIGYRLKNPGKGVKRYQLVLAPRKEGLCISISKDVLIPNILCLQYSNVWNEEPSTDLGKFWILPSKEDRFWESMQFNYPNLLTLGQTTGTFALNKREEIEYYSNEFSNFNINEYRNFINSPEEFDIKSMGSSDYYLLFHDDKLFPYTWQVCISSKEVLEEFISYFAKIILEQ